MALHDRPRPLRGDEPYEDPATGRLLRPLSRLPQYPRIRARGKLKVRRAPKRPLPRE